MSSDIDLDALLASEIPETSWSIDALGNLRCINLETGESEPVAHMCELSQQQREVIVTSLTEISEKAKYECDYIEGHNTDRSKQ